MENALQLEKILGVLNLKRQHTEKTLAQLTRSRQDLERQIADLSAPLDNTTQDDAAAATFAINIEKWNLWREVQKQELLAQHHDISQSIELQKITLQRLVVQIDSLGTQLKSAQKLALRELEKTRANQRLETWLAAKP